MPDYLVFGSCLRSELLFPELAESHGREPRWTLRLGSLGLDADGEVVADSQLSTSCRIRISRGNGQLRFFHSCAGTFELRANGREIVFDADRVVNLDAARNDLVARLLLMSADQDRVTWLHGSAVRLGRAAIAFVGASGSGKSTLALALARNGAQHICDDALPIEHTNPPVVSWSDGTIRLCDDTRLRFAPSVNSVRRESDGKFVVTQNALEMSGITRTSGEADDTSGIHAHYTDSRAPLSALYLLAPFTPGLSTGVSESKATRRLIAPSAAVPSLIRHLKLGALVASDYPVRKMRQLGEIVGVVPVFELRIPRGWISIDGVVAQLLAWHDPVVATRMPAETAGMPQ